MEWIRARPGLKGIDGALEKDTRNRRKRRGTKQIIKKKKLEKLKKSIFNREIMKKNRTTKT